MVILHYTESQSGDAPKPRFSIKTNADSEIVMVDGCFMVDGPCVNHAEKAVNHVLWLTVFLGRWLTEPCLI